VFQKVRSELSLILTDVIMPGKNGRGLSEELLQLEPGLRVLFMTGYSRDAFASDLNRHIELLQNGASDKSISVLDNWRAYPFFLQCDSLRKAQCRRAEYLGGGTV
jgi:CheY-like chemotaxis protein